MRRAAQLNTHAYVDTPKIYVHIASLQKQLKSSQASREQGKGWRERGNQSPAIPQKSMYIFSERHYLGQDDRNHRY